MNFSKQFVQTLTGSLLILNKTFGSISTQDFFVENQQNELLFIIYIFKSNNKWQTKPTYRIRIFYNYFIISENDNHISDPNKENR